MKKNQEVLDMNYGDKKIYYNFENVCVSSWKGLRKNVMKNDLLNPKLFGNEAGEDEDKRRLTEYYL